MEKPMMPEGQPAQGAAAPAEGSNAATEALFGMQEALSSLGSALIGQDNVPSEASDALQASIEAYNSFLSIYSEKLGMEGPQDPAAPVAAEAQGAKGAVSADMPMGKNMRAVPA